MIDPNFKSVLLISFAYITSIHVGDFLGTHSEHVEIHMYDCDFNWKLQYRVFWLNGIKLWITTVKSRAVDVSSNLIFDSVAST